MALHRQIPTFRPFCSPRHIRRRGLHSRHGLRHGNLRDLGSRRLSHRRNRLCLRDLQTEHVGASGEAERLVSNTTSFFSFLSRPVGELTASKARVSRFGRTALVALLPSRKVHVPTRAVEQIKGTMQKKVRHGYFWPVFSGVIEQRDKSSDRPVGAGPVSTLDVKVGSASTATTET